MTMNVNNMPLENLPVKRRLAASLWERVWWLQFEKNDITVQDLDLFIKSIDLDGFQTRYDCDMLVKAQLRSHNKLCLSICVNEMEDHDEVNAGFEIIELMIERFGPLMRLEDRLMDCWPQIDNHIKS